MYINKTILDELKQISPAVANIGNHNIYLVPDGYFQMLNDGILIKIAVAGFSSANPYSIPQGYFENLSSNIISGIKENESGEVSEMKWGNKNSFSVPDGYFDSLGNDILQKIKSENNKNEVSEELKMISPLLNGISKESVYSIPAGYFESLKPISKISENKQEGKLVKMSRPKWINYAAAACVAAVLLSGAYLFLNKNINAGSNKPQITNTNFVKALDVDKSIASLSDDEISNYLVKEVNNSIYENNSNETYDPDIDNLLESTSDEDLQKYLEENPELPNIHS